MIGTRRWGALLLVGVLLVSGCAGSMTNANTPATAPAGAGAPVDPYAEVRMARPGPYDRSEKNDPDILVQSQVTLSPELVAEVRATEGVEAAVQFSVATFYAEESAVTYAAVDPATFRSFTYGATAALDEVWNRIADGEIALRSDLRRSLATTGDFIQLGNDGDAQSAHIGAYAPLIERSRIGAVLNDRWAARLGMPKGNALIVSAGNGVPEPILATLRKSLGQDVSVTLLAPKVSVNDAQLAVLTGGSVARAVGSFTYTVNVNGTVNPDARWVTANIRTEQVPILGAVTCHKVMLVQLRAALQEILDRGLAPKIHRGEYGGCYVPRFIARDPAKGLSFHTFGTAIDLNVPGNHRGTIGDIDRTVVSIFKKWGFSWGGDWNYTDPMHFELSALVKVK